MPVDTSIYGQTQSYSDQFAKDQAQTASLQAQQSDAQLNKLRLLQAKSDYEDQQNLKAAWRQAGGDPTQTLAIASHLGVSPKSIQAFQAQQLELRTKMADLDKVQTDTGKTKLDIINERHEHLFNAAQPLTEIKDQAEYAAKLPGVIQQQLAQGAMTPDEAKAAGSMSQDQLKDYLNGIVNLKAHSEFIKGQTDLTNASSKATEANVASQRQANESAGQKADAILKQRTDASGLLTAAYNSGGPLAYGKALASLDPTVAGYFTGADAVAKAPDMVSARKLIGQGAMTAEQLSNQQQADRTEADSQAYRQKELALRQQSENVQQQMLGLDRAKTQAAMFTAGLGMDGKPIAGASTDLLKTQTQNTSDGRLYVDEGGDFGKLPKGQQMQIRTAANAAGVPLLSAKEAADVKTTDNARNTINSVFQTFLQNAGAGVSGVLLKPAQAIGNTIATATGLNPALDAANKNFISAIDTLKTAGGQGSGLRITGAEIAKVGAMQPKLGDTQEQIMEKAKQVNELINGKLNSSLHSVPITSKPASAGGISVGATATNPNTGQKIKWDGSAWRPTQ